MMQIKRLQFIILPVLLLAPFFASAAFERDLYFGILNDPEVTRLQEFLKNQGVYDGPVTGNFLTLTREGVKNFQLRESISPPAGYLGPKTRARANDLLTGAVLTPEEVIMQLTARIAELQARLTELMEQLKKEEEKVMPPVSVDVTPPQFTKTLEIAKEEFLTHPLPKGAQYPYRVMFDWATDEVPTEESLKCSPEIAVSEGTGKKAVYYPDPLTDYSCILTVKDSEGNQAQSSVGFVSPGWLALAGANEIEFPSSSLNTFKVGDFTVHNGTTSDILFAQLVMKVTDNMNSALNRSRKIIFTLRDGPTINYETVSKTDLTFHSKPPPTDNPHIYLVNLSFPELLKKGEAKTYGLWIDSLEYVISGYLRLEFDEFLNSERYKTYGGYKFTLTRETR